jgi:hypothetical protein
VAGGAFLALAFATPARAAATLFTAPVNHRVGKSIGCVMANVSDKSFDLTIELVNESGVTLAPFPVSATLPPGEVAKGFASSGIMSPFAYCAFTVEGGNANSVRAGYFLAEVDEEACFATGEAH